MCYWCRAQRPELVGVEVEVQPDREDAERDDAAVEVAAHFFFVSLSRGLLLRASAVAAVVAAVVKTWCAVAFDPNCSSRGHLRAAMVCKAAPLPCMLLRRAAAHKSFSNSRCWLVCYRTLASQLRIWQPVFSPAAALS